MLQIVQHVAKLEYNDTFLTQSGQRPEIFVSTVYIGLHRALSGGRSV